MTQTRPQRTGRFGRRAIRFGGRTTRTLSFALLLSVILGAAPCAFAQSSESGQVTVDAVLLSYVAAPLGSTGTAANTYTKSHATTLTLKSDFNSGVSFQADVKTFLTFTVGGGFTFKQDNSSSVARGITIRRQAAETYGTLAPAAPDATSFIGIVNPQMQLDGTTTTQKFRFLNSGSRLYWTRDYVRGLAGGQISQATANSMLAQYIYDKPTLDASTRFKSRGQINQNPGNYIHLAYTKSTGGTYSASKSTTTSTTITRSTGFMTMIANGTYTVGHSLTFTNTNAQEYTTDKIVTYEMDYQRSVAGVSEVYWDKALKTYTMVDLGPATKTYASGNVRDASGVAVAGALVKLRYNNADYMVTTDSSGNYVLKGTANIPSGSYELICGLDNQYVALGTTAGNFAGVDRTAATDYTINGETYNMN